MAEHVAAVPQSPVSDDVELEEFFGRTRTQHRQVPVLVIRKDSSHSTSADAATADAVTDADDAGDCALRLHTPAPIASFEVLSDVDESDMDDATSLDTAHSRDATFDLAAAAGSEVKGYAAAAAADDNYDDTCAQLVQANGTAVTAETAHVDVNDVIGSRDEWLVSGGAEVPRLVFEDVDADKPNQLSSPEECPEIVNNDNDNDVSDNVQQQQQQAWQWTADQDQGKVVHSSEFYYFNSVITARLHNITMLKYAVQTMKSRNVQYSTGHIYDISLIYKFRQ